MKTLIVMLILIMPALAYSQSNNKDWPYPPMGVKEEWDPEGPMGVFELQKPDMFMDDMEDTESQEPETLPDSLWVVDEYTGPMNFDLIETMEDNISDGIEIYYNYFAEGGSEIDNPIIIICKIDSKKDCRKLSKFLRQNKTK